jgi:small-conductance mechanosensitive channel
LSTPITCSRSARDTATAPATTAIPARQRATDASLHSRLTAALERNQQLAEQNSRLRQQLARALGDQRAARTQSGNNQPA